MRSLTLTVIGLMALTAPAFADATSDARKAIQGLYDTDNAAAARKDVNGIFAHTAEDCVEIDKKGKKHTLAETKAQLPMIFQMAKEIKAVSKISALRLSGSTATVTVNENASIKLQNPQNNQPMTMQIESTNLDTWVKTAKGWMKKKSQTVKEKELMNGQLMNAMGAGAPRKKQ